MRMKRGDLRPAVQITCYDGDPTAVVNLTTATSIRILGLRGSILIVDQTTTGTSGGVVTHNWVAGETDDLGRILFEVEVTWPGGIVQTFPGDSYLPVDIIEDLG